MSVQKLAKEAFEALEQAKREDGTEYIRIKDGSPQWIEDVIRDGAHDDGDWLPDDVRFAFAREALGMIADADEDADEDELRELLDEWEADPYTTNLTGWLHSHSRRIFYMDDVLDKWGGDLKSWEILALAQKAEFEEVFNGILQALVERAEEEDDEEDA